MNTGIHSFKEELALGKKLIESARGSGRSVRVYEDISGSAGIIESYWGFEEVANPLLANIQIIGPLDFVRPPTYRVQEITDSN